MVEIECLVCGKSVKMPQYINTEKYDGQVVCQECKALLYVKLVKGKVEKYKLIENKPKEFNFTKLVLAEKQKQQEKEKGAG